MKNVNDYFLKMTDKISFVELKENTTLNLKSYTIDENIPLPIVTDTLVREIKEGNLQEELKIAHVIEGIIYILGIDLDFKYKEQYIKILYSFNEKIEDFILYRGLKLYEEEYFDDSAILFRALININCRNINGIFNYALSLERIANKYFDMGDEKRGNLFLNESTNQLESILDIDTDYSLAYYKLGYHYRYYGQYQKARLMWEKFIAKDNSNIRVQEIRDELDAINDDADFEEGLNYIARGVYEKALDKFMPLASKHKNSWNIFYYIGIAYKGLGELEKAVEYLCEAVNLGGDESDLYNELGICLFGIGNIEEAIDIFTKGVEEYKADYKLRFNRGMAYLKIGDMEKAKADIGFAYEIKPDDPSVRDVAESLL